MFKQILLVGAAVACTLTLFADHAEAFGGRGYARRQVRRAYYAPAPVVVRRAYVAPVVTRYHTPGYYHAPVSVGVGHYGGYYGSGYRGYGSGVSVRIGW